MSEIWGGDILFCDDIVIAGGRGGRNGSERKKGRAALKMVPLAFYK